MKTSGRQFITRSKKGLTSPCKSCRRRIRPELLDKTYLCNECRNDPAAKWLAARTPEPAPPSTNEWVLSVLADRPPGTLPACRARAQCAGSQQPTPR